MNYSVQITENAKQDLLDLYDYIVWRDSQKSADYVFGKIREHCLNLKTFPGKGRYPPELDRIGIVLYREIHFKPYRIIFQISENTIIIHAILNGRRDLKDLLERRLLR